MAIVTVYYGKVGTQEAGSVQLEQGAPLPAWLADNGYVIVPQYFPLVNPPGEHGAYYLQSDLTWKWVREYYLGFLTLVVKYDEAKGTKELYYQDDWLNYSFFDMSQMGICSIASADQKITTQANKTARGKVTTDSSGNWTFSYASKGYTEAPVVSTDVEGAGGYVVNITSVTATSVSGNVVKPKSVVVGLLPYEAAGAGTKVHIIANPVS